MGEGNDEHRSRFRSRYAPGHRLEGRLLGRQRRAALVLFSIGGIAATIGAPSWLVWALSIGMGFVQSFTYAEIAGIFDEKAGGASNYGATAWLRYGREVHGAAVGLDLLVRLVAGAGDRLRPRRRLHAVDLLCRRCGDHHLELTLLDLGFLKDGLTLRINSTFFIGAATCSSSSSRSIAASSAPRASRPSSVAVAVAAVIVGIVPLLTGDVVAANFSPFTPLALDANKAIIPGEWNIPGWPLFLGGMFIAGWSAYGFETAVCYTREFRNPGQDISGHHLFRPALHRRLHPRALHLPGFARHAKMLEPGIYDGSDMAGRWRQSWAAASSSGTC